MTKFKNKKVRIIISCCLVAAILISGAFALLSAYDSRVNRFTSGTLSLSLTEENWDDTKAENLMPMQKVTKDPRIVNSNEENASAWVFASVKVPSTNVEFETTTSATDETTVTKPSQTQIGADGTILANAGTYYDLFSLRHNYEANDESETGYVSSTTDSIGVNPFWELVAVDTTKRNQDNGYTIYYYVYTKGALEGGATTELPLFDEVQLVNIAKRPQTSETTSATQKGDGSIDVQGCGIQQSGIEDVYTAWAIFANQNNGTNSVSNFTFTNSGFSINDGVVQYAVGSGT